MDNIKNELRIYIDNNLLDNSIMVKKAKFNKCATEDIELLYDYAFKSIDEFIDEHKEYNDFQTMLFKFIDNKDIKDSDVYNKVHIDRRLFSKIRSDKNYHPSKETIILLAIALELNENELDDLLESASYSLPKNNKYDLIIRFCFINKIFKLTDINDLLYDYNCKLFNY